MFVLPVTLGRRGLFYLYSFFLKMKESRVKVKFTLEQATKAQRGSRGSAVLFP